MGEDLTHFSWHEGLRLGTTGGAGTLTVIDGGTVEAGLIVAGESNGSNGEQATATILVDGTGSVLTVNENLQMFTGGTLTVSGGATLNTFADLIFEGVPNRTIIAPDRIDAYRSLGNSITVTVTGAGSAWHSGNAIRADNGVAMVVRDEASVSAKEGIRIGFGRNTTLDGPSVTLVVDNARLTTEGVLDIANGGAWADVKFINGALIETNGLMAGTGGTSSGGVYYSAQADILMSGAGTRWTDTSAFGLNLGNSGSTTLTLTDQAVIETQKATLGWNSYDETQVNIIVSDAARFTSATSLIVGDSSDSTSRLTVTGAGSRVEVGETLEIGRGGKGEVTLSDNADLSVAGLTGLGVQASGEGRMTVTGAGHLVTDQLELGLADGTASGFLTIGVDGASGRVDTNGFDLKSGTLTLGNGGVLDLSGGTAAIGAGGVVSGTGLIDGHLSLSGRAAPGHSIGTLNVGDITFHAGSVYEVEANAEGQADRINASGTATLNGGAVQVLAGEGHYAPATTYTILSATGGLTGTFSEGVTSNLAFLDPTLSYDALSVYLTLTRNDIHFHSAGLTPNQIAAGLGIESLGLGHEVYDGVLNLSAEQARQAFDQVSGDMHLSLRTALMEDSRLVRDALTDRTRQVTDVAYDGGRVWGQVIGTQGHWASDGNAARLKRSVGGFLVGAETAADHWRFGAVAGYSRARFKVKSRQSSGIGETYHLGLYGGRQWGDLAFRTGAAYSWHDVTTVRHPAYASFTDTLRSDYKANTAQVFGEVGYQLQAGAVALEPFAHLAHVRLRMDDLSEKGGAAALTTAKSQTDTTFSTVGLRASTRFELGQTQVRWTGTAGWRHAYGDKTPTAAMRFVDGGDAFAISGVPVARNAAVIETGLDMAVSENARLGVTYGGQFGSGMTDQALRITVNARF